MVMSVGSGNVKFLGNFCVPPSIIKELKRIKGISIKDNDGQWSVVAEWLGRRTLKQKEKRLFFIKKSPHYRGQIELK
jgi:hypothetical protein